MTVFLVSVTHVKQVPGWEIDKADLIHHALDLRERRVAAFKEQVRRHKFYQIMPIAAMD